MRTAIAAIGLSFASIGASAPDRPWANPALPPDARATLVESRMTLDEMIQLVDGKYAMPAHFMPGPPWVPPKRALGSAGFIPGVARLKIPDLQESDAGLGVADPVSGVTNRPIRANGYSVAMPSGLATAATWDAQTAFAGGAMIGGEAHEEGFNVLLGPGLDLTREPRNGRNFEYAGEDPLLAGTIAGAEIRGIQSRHVVATAKHYALNDQETHRGEVSADIDWAAARESDLLAFQIALEQGRPGAVMCAYNRINSVYSCGNGMLLNRILKHDWKYAGWVMSDWGAAHGTEDAIAGQDQESADYFDGKPFFGSYLKQAVLSGLVPRARLRDMVHRILRSMFANGLFDDPPVVKPIDAASDASIAQRDEERAIVLLKNEGSLLPLSRGLRSIAVIGSHADAGVVSGGGSSQVWPVGGSAVPPPRMDFEDLHVFDPSSPMRAIQALAPDARVVFDEGSQAQRAARIASHRDVAIVFASQWTTEGIDAANLSLPDRQDRLIEAVASANPRTIVVLETGGPVTMPWLSSTTAVLEAWYPGQRGGDAIANVLFGVVSPSGRLPITFPRGQSQLPRPVLGSANYHIDGANVGYKWYDSQRLTPLFPFGYGLTYSTFRYSNLHASHGAGLRIQFEVTNTGARRAAEVAQVYVRPPSSAPWHAKRLAGWQRVDLAPGSSAHISVRVNPKIISWYDAEADRWRIARGTYRVVAGRNERDEALSTSVEL